MALREEELTQGNNTGNNTEMLTSKCAQRVLKMARSSMGLARCGGKRRI